MKRKITTHEINGMNKELSIHALGEPGSGGANTQYLIEGSPESKVGSIVLQFQEGPISSTEDINGLSNEALLAVLIDRMSGFQYLRNEDGSFDVNRTGRYWCSENADALTHLHLALTSLQQRTKSRTARGVEGTHTP